MNRKIYLIHNTSNIWILPFIVCEFHSYKTRVKRRLLMHSDKACTVTSLQVWLEDSPPDISPLVLRDAFVVRVVHFQVLNKFPDFLVWLLKKKRKKKKSCETDHSHICIFMRQLFTDMVLEVEALRVFYIYIYIYIYIFFFFLY